MKRIILLAIIGCLTLGGWALAQQQGLLDHPNIHLQTMEDNSCSSSSGSPPGQ